MHTLGLHYPLVVLVGPHCSGKSTIGRRVADALGWRWDGEIGDRLYEEGRAEGRPFPDDREILEAEQLRDGNGRRVCESWHPGNLAWAQHRPAQHRPTNWPAIVDQTKQAAAAVVAVRPVVYVLVDCDEATRRARRAESGIGRLPPFQGLSEDAFFEQTRTVGIAAHRWAEELAELGARVVRVDTSASSTDHSVEEVLTLIIDNLLPPPSMPEAPYWFDSLSSALALLRRAGSLVPALHDELVECEALLQSTEAAPPDACSAWVISVDGLDGCGKSTLVGELARTLRGVQVTTPSGGLRALRALVEADRTLAVLPSADQRKRVKRAFYMVSNYVALLEASRLVDERSATCVVLDRSYSSTAAYTLGVPPTVSQDELPPAAWRWPRDLRQPDLALLLEAGPAVRQARIEARAGGVGIGIGEWERRVKGDPSLGENIHLAYRHLQLERRVVLDAAQRPQAVLAQAVEAFHTIEGPSLGSAHPS